MSDPLTEVATAVVNIRVVPGHVAEFVDWQNEMNDVVSHFDGFVSTNVVTPADPAHDDFVIIYQFASARQLKAWMDSGQRLGMLDKITDALVGAGATSIVIGGAVSKAAPEPVTAVITVHVRPGADEQYRDWQRRIAELMAQQRGHLGTNVQEPIHGLQEDWVIMTKFDTEEHLSQWINSRARARMLSEAEPLVETSSVRRVRTSFDGWFPFTAGQRPPRNWQQTALVLLALFPVVCLELVFLNPFLAWMPESPATFIGNAISVALTGFILVPLAASAFRRWLVPNASRARLWTGSLIVLAGFAISIVVMEFLFRGVKIPSINGF